jgi:hypothetical protein
VQVGGRHPGRCQRQDHGVAFTATYAALAWSAVTAVLARLRRREHQGETSGARSRSLGRQACWAVLILLVLAPAVGLTLPPQQAGDVGPWTAFRFAHALSWLAGWLGLVYLLLALESLSDAPLRVDAGRRRDLVRWAGIVFVVFSFYWPSQNWLYIPVTIILGWVLAATFLLPRAKVAAVGEVEAAAEAARVAGEPARGQREPRPHPALVLARKLLDAALRISQAEAAVRAGRAAQAKQAAVKETDADATARPGGEDQAQAVDLAALEQRLREEEAAFPVKVEGKSGKQVALGLVPSASLWQDGWLAARYGFYFGLPWLLLSLWDLATGPGTLGEGTLLAFLAEAAWILLQWTVFGFFFGYFYPYLRGDSGTQKSFCLFVTIVLPPLAYTLVTVPRSGWPTFLLWALQVLLFSLVLGILAGDLASLWRVRLGWPQLVQLQNLRFFVTFASSLAVAGGAAVATWISTGATLLTTVMDRVTDVTGPSPPPGP